ncbi:carboxypeptidase-like regulatory domain-containing protein [Myxococcus sp. K15C18031901]|uniref:carboxypeptidase-like regulatory domain-containing protein n=1 Tax=Myxococcus dinghuensis TaxID=2906761 RepID=UPI0020A82114|nr:carboxypeptidase-like regulatory domain-containing protein [Myxococcus dinghuensis]MCP3103039.1 carboxypeptidase-like regulatory domain-containing protein [Myxococcus dinghuensis]
MKHLFAVALCITTLSASAQAYEPSGDEVPKTGTLFGTVIDSQSRQPVADVIVTLNQTRSSEAVYARTDAQGSFRFPQAPAGTYVLRFEKEEYKPYARSDILLRAHRTVRVNVEFLPEYLGQVVLLRGDPPVVDLGSTTQGIKLDTEFMRRIPIR